MKIFYFLPTLFLAIYAEGTALSQTNARNGGAQVDSIHSANTADSIELGLDQVPILFFVNYSIRNSKTNAFNEIYDSNIFTGQPEFNSGNIYDPLGLAEGRIAGLAITKPGDNPNMKYDARIRGLSNIHGNTMPLIVVDGHLDASLENVDPADIESMTVIKDAAATAFYGIRGANGVILISTKKGDGKPQVSYNTYLNVENAMRRQKSMSRDEYLVFSDELDFAQATDLGHDTNWYDEILNTAISQAHNLNISGGNLTTKYYSSLNYRNVNGVLANTGFDRFSARFNVEQKALKDKLTLGLSVAGTLNNSNYGNSDAFRYAPIYNPTAPVRSDDPGYEQFDGYFQQILFNYYNPVAMVDQTVNDGQYSLFNIRIRGDYSITDKLSVNASYSVQTSGIRQNEYYSKYSFYKGFNRGGLALKSYDESYNQLFETGLHWADIFDIGKFQIEAGYSYQEFINEGFSVEGGDFITDAFTYNNLGAANDFANGIGMVNSYKNSNKIIGWYGRFAYSWNERLFLNIVGRYDGSSMFGENAKYGFYPGISAGVDFARILSLASFDVAKLRVGYGKSGQMIGENYRSLAFMGAIGQSVYYNGAFIQQYGFVNASNPDLKAPVKSEINIGVDYDFKGMIYGSLDYYSNTINDLVWKWMVPTGPYYSITEYWTNTGELYNSGLEFNVSANLFPSKKFAWTPSIIVTRYFNTSLGTFSDEEKGLYFAESYYLYPTYPGSGGFGHILVQENEKVGNFNGLTYQAIAENGQWVFKDINKDQVIDDEDRSVIGNAMPKMELGFGNYLTFGRWDLSAFFKGVFGHDMVNEYFAGYGAPQIIQNYNVPNMVKEMKSESGVYLQEWASFSSYYLEKGSYFGLHNFSLGYNFDLKQSGSVKDLRVFLTGNNVFVITSYSGSDPEIRYSDSAFGYNPLAPGMERMAEWLMTRSLALGLTVKF